MAAGRTSLLAQRVVVFVTVVGRATRCGARMTIEGGGACCRWEQTMECQNNRPRFVACALGVKLD